MNPPGALAPTGLARWSKTAAIVVVVVFALVVALSIAGMLAFEGARDADAEDIRKHSLSVVKTRLEDRRREVRESLENALRSWAGARHGADLIALRREPLGGVLREALVLSPGQVAWIDRRTVLHLDPDRLAAAFAADEAAADDQEQRAADLLARSGPPLEIVTAWCDLLEPAPLATTTRIAYGRWPLALSYLTTALDRAAEMATDDPHARALLRRLVLLGTSMASLHALARHFERAGLESKLRHVEAALKELASRLGSDPTDPVVVELAALAAARALLADVRAASAMERAAATVRALAGATGVGGRVFMQYAPPALVGLVVLEGAQGEAAALFAARLDVAALGAQMHGDGADERLLAQGARFEVVYPQSPASNPNEQEGALLAETTFADLDGAWNLPFRFRAWRVADPAAGTLERSAWTYWLILALALVGASVGAWVLVRLLTREVRLARLKADFVGNLSHELKTPITGISLFTEMLQSGRLQGEEARQEAYGVLAQEVGRLERVVERMLDVARREVAGSPYTMVLADLREPVSSAIERFKRLVPPGEIDLEVLLPDRPVLVRHDKEAIEDVVANLLSNAWKYRHGEHASVRVQLEARPRTIRLSVADDGVGIPPGERRRVFDMFYRAEAYLTRVSGTGLGLSLVRTLIKGHGGRTRVRGVGLHGRGTTFEVDLPAARVRRAHGDPGDSHVTPPSDFKGGTPPRSQTGDARASPPAVPARRMGDR